MSTRKLLLADDSITIQKVVNLTFADEGIEVITVGNGDSAMEKMAEFSPDLVMADINMPGLNGYQVCERIKQNDNFKQTPVILLVGSFEPFDEEEARRVGADDFLTKPFQSIRQLVSKVTVLLDANDRSAAQLYDATANNSFANTLDMETPEIADSDKVNDLGDAGMDDEMIQTNRVSNFALDDSAKFETKEVAEPVDDLGKTQPLSVYDLKEFSFVAQKQENDEPFSEAADPNESESQHFNETGSDESASRYFIENGNSADETEPESQNADESDLAENNIQEERMENFSSSMDSSEDDFLEIPFDEDEDEWETEENAEETSQTLTVESEEKTAEEVVNSENEAASGEFSQQEFNEEVLSSEGYRKVQSEESNDETPAFGFDEKVQPPETDDSNISPEAAHEISTPEVSNEVSWPESEAPEYVYHGEDEVVVGSLIEPENKEDESANEQEDSRELNGNRQISESSTQFSPELIDAIAQKVIEKLSDQVVREIAWEVVPQHADLIIKKMVEEKLREQ